MHEDAARDERQLVAAGLGVRVGVARELDLGAQLPHGIHLDGRRRARHDDVRAQPEMARCVGHALRVIAGAGRDDAAGALVRGEVRDAVVGAAQFVGEDGLLVLALEEHLVARPRGQPPRRVQRRRAGDVVRGWSG